MARCKNFQKNFSLHLVMIKNIFMIYVMQCRKVVVVVVVVVEGSIPEGLAKSPPGNVHQARWVTMAN